MSHIVILQCDSSSRRIDAELHNVPSQYWEGLIVDPHFSVMENTTSVIHVRAITTGDPADLRFSISGGADAAKFKINASTGLLEFLSAPNYEIPVDANLDNVYEVIVTATDTGLGLSDVQKLTVTVKDATEPVSVLGQPVGTLANWDHVFHWAGLPTATWYLLEVQTSGGIPQLNKWYDLATVGSDNANCSISPAELVALANGQYKWRIQDYGGYGYGLYTAWQDFTLS